MWFTVSLPSADLACFESRSEASRAVAMATHFSKSKPSSASKCCCVNWFYRPITSLSLNNSFIIVAGYSHDLIQYFKAATKSAIVSPGF